jgi:hypothetical protein
VIRLTDEVDALRSETSFMEKIEIVSEKEWSNTMVVARSQKPTWWPCRWLRARMMGGAVANSTPDKTKWGFQTSKPTHT